MGGGDGANGCRFMGWMGKGRSSSFLVGAILPMKHGTRLSGEKRGDTSGSRRNESSRVGNVSLCVGAAGDSVRVSRQC